jgi:hypothetical protein
MLPATHAKDYHQPAWIRLARVCALMLPSLAGCAAITNPVANGLAVRQLEPALLGSSREVAETIPLHLLGQRLPDAYRLAPGDVLGVYAEGVLGERNQTPPVHFPEASNLPPALGFPIPIRENGTIPLPLIDPVPVAGMTVPQAEQAIINAYSQQREILAPGRRIIVTLVRPRQTRVLVIRQDSATPDVTIRTTGFLGGAGGGTLLNSGSRRGTGAIVELPAYENDVLHALTATGGLPGSDAVNEVVIQRVEHGGQAAFLNDPHLLGEQCTRDSLARLGGRITRIPLRLPPGQPVPFRPEDVILQTGDIVFIESRDPEFFYTGGLLFAGEYPIPRDYDLDVIEALAAIGYPHINGGISSNNLSGALSAQGLGRPNPSLLIVLRKTPGGGQLPIRVDLNQALRDPRERILVQPGDVLILQETPGEAIARYFSQQFNFTIVSRVIQTSTTTGTATLSVP